MTAPRFVLAVIVSIGLLAAPRRWPWARLLQRVFGFEVLVCDRCGGRHRVLGAVTEPDAVRRVLVALGLAAEAPPGEASPAA
jgi:hypothetical protein